MRSTRENRRRETEARVLAVAGELFRTSGPTVVTVRDIAAAAGVSTGTVMSVGDKNALLVASFDQSIKEIHQARAENSASFTGGVAEQIAALFDPFVELFAADPELARKYGSVLVSGETESIIFTDLAGVLIGEIEVVLRDVDVRGARALAESIYFAYIGRIFTWPSQEDHHVDEQKRSLKRIVAAICRVKEFEV